MFQNYTINYWLDNGLEKEKLILGMPFYGQSFKLASANNNGLNAKAFGGATGSGDCDSGSGASSWLTMLAVPCACWAACSESRPVTEPIEEFPAEKPA